MMQKQCANSNRPDLLPSISLSSAFGRLKAYIVYLLPANRSGRSRNLDDVLNAPPGYCSFLAQCLRDCVLTIICCHPFLAPSILRPSQESRLHLRAGPFVDLLLLPYIRSLS